MATEKVAKAFVGTEKQTNTNVKQRIKLCGEEKQTNANVIQCVGDTRQVYA